MTPFNCGYLAGIISILLPSLVALALLLRAAPMCQSDSQSEFER